MFLGDLTCYVAYKLRNECGRFLKVGDINNILYEANKKYYEETFSFLIDDEDFATSGGPFLNVSNAQTDKRKFQVADMLNFYNLININYDPKTTVIKADIDKNKFLDANGNALDRNAFSKIFDDWLINEIVPRYNISRRDTYRPISAYSFAPVNELNYKKLIPYNRTVTISNGKILAEINGEFDQHIPLNLKKTKTKQKNAFNMIFSKGRSNPKDLELEF
jgi:hypothetical protein